MFDERGAPLCTPARMRVDAHPADINDLAHISGDPRTVHKLFLNPDDQPEVLPVGSGDAARPDGVPPLPADTAKGAADVWLSPWAPGEVNGMFTFLIWQPPSLYGNRLPYTAGERDHAVL